MYNKNSDQPSPRDRQLHSKDNEVGFSTKNTIATSCPAASMEVLGNSAPALTRWVTVKQLKAPAIVLRRLQFQF